MAALSNSKEFVDRDADVNESSWRRSFFAAKKRETLHRNILKLVYYYAYYATTQVWLTTWKEITADPLGAIWVQPREYLEVTKGTAFDPAIERRKGMYRRKVEREAMVEREVRKRWLLEP